MALGSIHSTEEEEEEEEKGEEEEEEKEDGGEWGGDNPQAGMALVSPPEERWERQSVSLFHPFLPSQECRTCVK